MTRDLLSIFWRSDLTSVRSRRPGRRRVASRSACRPGIEVLERRLTLTTLPPGFTEAPVVSGLSSPTVMEFAPDGRLFVLEQGGNVKLVHNDGTTWTALHLNVDPNGERGLLGIAFDPDYNANHFVYLYYTNPNPGGASWATGEHNQLSRFTVDDSNPQQPTFTDEAPILDWNNLISATNHNGGAIHFGLDGMLYADAGDNTQTFSQGGSTYRVSQTLSTLLGKQLRIDVSSFNSGTATRDDTTVGHLIPIDNPFVGTASGINQLIYNLGLRNPFTFAVQPGTGTIFINDVGETTWEEIDQSVAGANYGWSGGNTDGFGQSPPGPGTYHDPLLAYNHQGGPAGGGIAIVGGTFYNPATPSFPSSYVGKYFYADLGGGWIRVFDPAKPGNASNPDTSTAFASGTSGSLRDLKVDSSGNLYYLAGNGGVINKISLRLPCRRWATPASRRHRSAWATTKLSSMPRRAPLGPTLAAPGSRATAAASPPATPTPPRAPRWASSRAPGHSARTSPAGPPAPIRSASTRPSEATIRRRTRTSRSWSTATSWAPSPPTALATLPSRPLPSASPPGRTPSCSTGGTAPAAITPPSSTTSKWPRRWATPASSSDRSAWATTKLSSTTPPAHRGPSPAVRASPATTAASPRAIPPRPRGSRSPSSREPARSPSRSPAGQPASYVLTFDAAQRGNFGVSRQNFEVLIDGKVVDTFTPSSTSYQSYTTAAFTVTAGTHTITVPRIG